MKTFADNIEFYKQLTSEDLIGYMNRIESVKKDKSCTDVQRINARVAYKLAKSEIIRRVNATVSYALAKAFFR